MPFDLLAGLLTTAVINGVMAAPIMAGLMLLAGEKSVMGNFTSDLRTTGLSWDDAAVMGFAVLMMLRDVVRQICQTDWTGNRVLSRDGHRPNPVFWIRRLRSLNVADCRPAEGTAS